jgi:hypothetical protein
MQGDGTVDDRGRECNSAEVSSGNKAMWIVVK